MLPEMSIALLERQMRGEDVAAIHVETGPDGFSYGFESRGEKKAELEDQKNDTTERVPEAVSE
jgi:type VI secretion system protein VasG